MAVYFEYLLTYQDAGLFVLRLALGVIFVAHGYPKLFKMFGGFAGWLESIGIKPGKFWAAVVGVTEFFGGIAVILGVFTQVAGLLLAINMIVAMAKVKWGKVKMIEMDKMGWEIDLALFALALALVFLGAGAYSLSRYLGVGF